MRNVTSPSWIYRRLYTGSVRNGLDRLIVDLMPSVLDLPNLDGWFFIRFADSSGPHLRLRVRLPSQQASEFDAICLRALQALPRQPPFLYRSALAVGQFGYVVPDHAVIRVAEDEYLPETDKFGKTSMGFAEDLFECSSHVATQILEHENRGYYSRKSIVIALMDEARRRFVPAIEPENYWEDYARLWFSTSGEVGDVIWRKLEDKAVRLADQGDLADVLSLPERARPLGEVWARALEKSANNYRETPEEAISPEKLAGSFAHLMNNRLGLFPLEEAYYALLLRHACAGVRTDA
ncbi:thiopeptide-type bacteriocin biosynthesis protein [Ruegeria sp. SCP11]|uniref:thiopeptide-type bacteriocin biosynthesis protein n=1 Tax=Ruegeria sp. SCP11 TaxID=3141378 RepID=UPI00333C0A6A